MFLSVAVSCQAHQVAPRSGTPLLAVAMAREVSPELLEHSRSCRDASCPCKSFVKNFEHWAPLLPLCESHPEETWLWHRFFKREDGRVAVTWTCVACDTSGYASHHYAGQRTESCSSKIRLANLQRHQESPDHLRAIADKFGLDMSSEIRNAVTAPTLELFKELVEAFQKGGTTTSGFKLRTCSVSVEKANELLWCCEEAIVDTRLELISSADSTCIMRDERHHRMHLRYRIGRLGRPPRAGFLGQSRNHKPDSIGLSEATVEIYKACCTRFSNPPRGCLLTPVFEEAAYKNLCKTTEAISIDSAENEVVAVKDMKKLPDFPDRVFTLRDLPHGSRRVLSRLWKADQTMDDCFGLFCHWKESPAQIIQWSDDMRAVYSECTKASPCSAIASNFTHMRAAKHRLETMLTPLSRSVLDPDATIGFAQKISIIKKGQAPGKAMVVFLETVTPELFLLAAMMSDGAALAFDLIRFLDTEDVPMAEICSRVEEFLDHIAWLFFEGGVFQIKGHTAFICTWYSSKVHHFTINGKGRAFGGQEFSEAQKQWCLEHLQAWVVLVKPTLEAEFSSFSLVNAFAVFKLPRDPKASVNLCLNESALTKLRRLESTFNQRGLEAEFRRRFGYALKAYVDSSYKASYWDAWRSSLPSGSEFCQCLRLAYVVCRGETYAPVTSGVEQSFSKVAARLGSNRLNAAEATENMAVTLLVTKFTRSDLDDLAARAQSIWKRAFFHKNSRQNVAQRCDAGVHRRTSSNPTGPGLLTERKFMMRLRDEVRQSAPAGSSSVLSNLESAVWTPGHQGELVFQQQKTLKRKIEARSLKFFCLYNYLFFL